MTATERRSERTAATARPTTPAPMTATSTSACERAAHIGNWGTATARPAQLNGSAGRYQRPRLGALHRESQVQQQRIFVTPCVRLQADGEAAAGDAGRGGDRRVAGEVGRDGQSTGVVGTYRNLTHLVGHRALGREGFHWAGGAEQDVHLLEQVGHRLVHLYTERLYLRAVPGPVLGRGLHGEADLESQGFLAVRPVILQGSDERREPCCRPGEAVLRPLPPPPPQTQARRLDQHLRRLPHDARHLRMDDGVAQVRRDGYPQPPQVAVPETLLPAVDAGQAERIARIVAAGDAGPAGGVADAAGHCTLH